VAPRFDPGRDVLVRTERIDVTGLTVAQVHQAARQAGAPECAILAVERVARRWVVMVRWYVPDPLALQEHEPAGGT
jgi:hypothetical protein